jgi:hypothetical protein
MLTPPGIPIPPPGGPIAVDPILPQPATIRAETAIAKQVRVVSIDLRAVLVGFIVVGLTNI